MAVVLSSAVGWGQAPVGVPAIALKDLNRVEQTVYTTPPTLKLIPHGPGGRAGAVWVRSSELGLHVWGRVEAEQAGYVTPRQKSETLGSDHVEVWLAVEPDVPLPKVGWGNQFGPTELETAKDCEQQNDTKDEAVVRRCKVWYEEQRAYRTGLRRLFARQWLIALSDYKAQAYEEFATTAYAGLKAGFYAKDLPLLLEPKADDGVTAEIGVTATQKTVQDANGRTHAEGVMNGYTFQVLIPYAAFPPAHSLQLKDLSLMVDVFRAAPAGRKMGEFSTTSTTRVWGKPASFNRLRLAVPKSYAVTPCREPLQQTDLYGETFPGWILPAKDEALASSFALINPERGYLYEPGSVSPEVVEKKSFWKTAAGGATVCGPELAWRKGDSVVRSKFNVDAQGFETKLLPDGWTLVRSGPKTWTQSPFGSGQCGACPIMGMDLYAVSPSGAISAALNLEQGLSGQMGSPSGADVTIAPDWSKITLFSQFVDDEKADAKPEWKSESFCRVGHAYASCGKSGHVRPPEPANYPELRRDD